MSLIPVFSPYLTGLGSPGFDLEDVTYNGVLFSVASQTADPQGLFFKPDGTKFYVIDNSTEFVEQYSLSTAWDVSTASYDSKQHSVISEEAEPNGVFFKDDGTKMYIVGDVQDAVFQYTLSTAWDVSTASYDSVSLSVSSQDSLPEGLFFGDSGSKLYMVGSSSDRVYQYNLSSAWDLSTASYASKSVSVGPIDNNPSDVFFSSNGRKMFMLGDSNNGVFQYGLSTAWDISTASYDGVAVTFVFPSTTVGLSFKGDGTKMYLLNTSDQTVYQFSIG